MTTSCVAPAAEKGARKRDSRDDDSPATIRRSRRRKLTGPVRTVELYTSAGLKRARERVAAMEASAAQSEQAKFLDALEDRLGPAQRACALQLGIDDDVHPLRATYDLTALSRPPSEICLFHCPPKLRSDLVGDVSHELAFERMHAHLSVSIMREAYGVELPHHQAVCARWAQCCEDIAYQCLTKPGSEPSDADMKEAAALLDACVNGEAPPRAVDLELVRGLKSEVDSLLAKVCGDDEWSLGHKLRALRDSLRGEGEGEPEIRTKLMRDFFADCKFKALTWTRRALVSMGYTVNAYTTDSVVVQHQPGRNLREDACRAARAVYDAGGLTVRLKERSLFSRNAHVDTRPMVERRIEAIGAVLTSPDLLERILGGPEGGYAPNVGISALVAMSSTCRRIRAATRASLPLLKSVSLFTGAMTTTQFQCLFAVPTADLRLLPHMRRPSYTLYKRDAVESYIQSLGPDALRVINERRGSTIAARKRWVVAHGSPRRGVAARSHELPIARLSRREERQRSEWLASVAWLSR